MRFQIFIALNIYVTIWNVMLQFGRYIPEFQREVICLSSYWFSLESGDIMFLRCVCLSTELHGITFWRL